MVDFISVNGDEYVAWCINDDSACDGDACYHLVNGRISRPFCPRYDADFDKLIKRLFGRGYWKENSESPVKEVSQ